MARKNGRYRDNDDGNRSHDIAAAETDESSLDSALHALLKAIAQEPVPPQLHELADQLQRKLDRTNGQE